MLNGGRLNCGGDDARALVVMCVAALDVGRGGSEAGSSAGAVSKVDSTECEVHYQTPENHQYVVCMRG